MSKEYQRLVKATADLHHMELLVHQARARLAELEKSLDTKRRMYLDALAYTMSNAADDANVPKDAPSFLPTPKYRGDG